MLNFDRKSLSFRIFTSMLVLVLIAFTLISGITYYQYREQVKDYNIDRLDRKENSIKKEIDRTLETTTYQMRTDRIRFIFKDEIYDISRIHGENITLYDLEGKPLISSASSPKLAINTAYALTWSRLPPSLPRIFPSSRG